MSPAVIRRIEHVTDRHGWAYVNGLDCFKMPGPSSDDGLTHWKEHGPSHYIFGWTGESFEEWVSVQDAELFATDGYIVRHFMCPPGTVIVGDHQVVFDRSTAVVIAERPVIAELEGEDHDRPEDKW